MNRLVRKFRYLSTDPTSKSASEFTKKLQKGPSFEDFIQHGSDAPLFAGESAAAEAAVSVRKSKQYALHSYPNKIFTDNLFVAAFDCLNGWKPRFQ